MITTFRLARQANRWCRFAEVTVSVVPAARDVVTVAPGAHGAGPIEWEAACGARRALRRAPGGGGRQVTVTRIVATETDTAVGDVYEATARAVWQALSVNPMSLPAGFSEPQMVVSWLSGVIGLRVVAVTGARYWHDGERDPDTAASLVHVWLHFEHRPPIQLHGIGDDLELSIEDPYPAYDMGHDGEVRVAAATAPDLLADVVGRRLTDAAIILGPSGSSVCAGLLLRLEGLDVVIGTFCDEWVLATGRPPAHLHKYWLPQPWILQR